MTKVIARHRVSILAAIARRVNVSAMRDAVSKDAGTVKSNKRTRVRVSVFSKPLAKFESALELTEEEKEVVKKSQELLK